MYGNPQRRTAEEVLDLRREGGRWLKAQRERVGLSQRQLSNEVGTEYYTFISQLESGRGRIPPDRYLVWAEALKMSPREFVQAIMRFYDPVTYEILFGSTYRFVHSISPTKK
jgi:transcriptional regulator with XRE-family HTH domain